MSFRTVAVPTAAFRTTATRAEATHADIPDVAFNLIGDLYGRGDTLITPTFTRAAPDAYLNWNGTYYAETTNIPRFEADSTPLGLLIEGSGTNSFLYSRDFSDAAWVKSGPPTYTQDQIGFDGVANTAWTLGDDNAAALEFFRQDVTVANDSNTHCWHILIKADSDTSRFPEIQTFLVGGTSVGSSIQLNTSTGATNIRTGSAVVTSTRKGDWWHLVATETNNTTGNVTARINIYPAITTTWGNTEVATTGTIVVDMPSIELNASTASSPIPTEGSAVTRAADDCTVALGSWFSTTEGTLIVTLHVPIVGTVTRRVLTLSDGTASNRILLFRNGGDDTQMLVTDGGVAQVTINSVAKWVDGQTSKVAIAWKLNDFALYQDGTSLGTDGAGTIPTGLTTLGIGQAEGGTPDADANFKAIQYFNTRKSNADLARLTS